MPSPRRKAPPPAWLDLSQPLNDHVRTQRCPRCHAPTLRALVGNPCGLNVRADPKPLDIPAEIAMRLAGCSTYCLKVSRWAPPRLINREPTHIASGNCRHPVVADHQCPPHPVQEALL